MLVEMLGRREGGVKDQGGAGVPSTLIDDLTASLSVVHSMLPFLLSSESLVPLTSPWSSM